MQSTLSGAIDNQLYTSLLEAARWAPSPSGGRDLISEVSFDLHAGEVLGIAGVEGNGQSELIEAILGLRKYTGGVYFKGESLDQHSVSDRRDLGIGFIPEDRQRQALLIRRRPSVLRSA